MRDGKVVVGRCRAQLSTARSWSPPWADRAPRPPGLRPSRRLERTARLRSLCACARAQADGIGMCGARRARSSASRASQAMARPIFCWRSSPPPRVHGASATSRRAGRACRRRPADRRHIPAMVDRREHRRPLAEEIARQARCSRRAWKTRSPTAGASASRSARPTWTTTFSRSPAAISRRRCSRARLLGRADHPDGRSDARRRFRHQARGLRPDPRGGRGGRTFLWYTTEIEELRNCDRAYVFRNGASSPKCSATN